MATKDSSMYGSKSWQQSNVDEQNRDYGIKKTDMDVKRQGANKQEPAGGPSSDSYI